MRLLELLNSVNRTLPLTGMPVKDAELTGLVYDSRADMGEKDMFVCLRGARADGHDFARSAYDRGVRMFAAEAELGLPEDASVVLCGSTRKFLALASAALFGFPAERMKVIGITGTKGKTSTSFLLKSILESAGIRCGVIGSTGVYYGDVFRETVNTTPESYLLHRTFREMADAGCGAVVMEAASQGFKMDRTYGIRFDAGVFTNLSPDHIGEGEHASFEEYLNCKRMLFDQSEIVYVNADDEHFGAIVEGKSNWKPYGLENDCHVRAEDPEFRMDGHRLATSFTCVIGGRRFRAELGVPGYFSLYNACAAAAVADGMGIGDEAIREGLKHCSVRGRMESIPSGKPYTVLIDAAHEEFSSRALLKTVRLYSPKRIIALFGCGGNRSRLRRPGMGRAVGENADYAIVTADNSRMEKVEDIIADILTGLEPTGCPYEIEPDRKTAIEKALAMAQPGDAVLLMGKGHENYVDCGGKKTFFSEKQIVLDYWEREARR